MEREHTMTDFTDIAMMISSVLLKIKGAFLFSVSCAVAYFLSLFLPVSTFVYSLYLLIGIDLWLGSWAAKRDNEEFDREKAFLTSRKFVVYFLAVIVAGHFEVVYAEGVSIAKIVAGVIALSECRSIYGHISKLSGIQLWDTIWSIVKDKFPIPKRAKGISKKKDEEQ